MKNVNSWKQKKNVYSVLSKKKNKQTLLTKISHLYTTREFGNSNILKYNMKSRFVCKKKLMKSARKQSSKQQIKEKVDTPIWKPVSTSIFSELQVYIFNSYLITSELCYKVRIASHKLAIPMRCHNYEFLFCSSDLISLNCEFASHDENGLPHKN